MGFNSKHFQSYFVFFGLAVEVVVGAVEVVVGTVEVAVVLKRHFVWILMMKEIQITLEAV